MRTVLLSRTMDEDSVIEFVTTLAELNEESEDDITLIINCSGGFEYALTGMLSAIRYSKAKIIGHVYGECYSFALPILLACDDRVASPFARFMIHDVSCSFNKGSHPFSEWTSKIEQMTWARNLYIRMIIENTRISKEFLMNIFDKREDYFFGVDEALKLGVINEVK